MINCRKIILFIALFSCISVRAQDSSEILSRFINYSNHSFSEKLYVHTDKEYYHAGEVIWFKIYAVDGYFNRPSSLSRIGYVELLDAGNRPVMQAKILLDSTSGSGSLLLPADIPTANYKFVAYTRWMKNFSPDFYFEKEISIVNVQQPFKSNSSKEKKYSMALFPEGGNLVENIKSRVGFKITDNFGKGINGYGVIINKNGDTVANLKTLQFGIGHFDLTPATNDNYRALVTLGNGDTLSSTVPSLYKEGYVMHLIAADSIIRISVQSSLNDSIFLLAHTRGIVKYISKRKIINGTTEFLINKNIPGEGISHFTVFNNKHQPVCERLYFKYHEKKLQLNVKSSQSSYGLREKVHIDISSFNEENIFHAADLSMAVYKLDSLVTRTKRGITEYLWLLSDLTGSIENPEYYFQEIDEEKKEAIDNLMLTQGWRRFRWNDINTGKTPDIQYEPEIRGHIVHVTIKNRITNLPAEDIAGFLTVTGKHNIFRTGKSNFTGDIPFELNDFYGKRKLITQINALTDSVYTAIANNAFSLNHSSRKISPFISPVNNPSTLLEQDISAQVQDIFVSEDINRFKEIPADKFPFYEKPDATYLTDNYTRFNTIEEVLREYVQPVVISRRSGQLHASIYDQYTRLPFSNDPLILLDGLPIFNINKLLNYDPAKVERIDVVTKKYFLGDVAYDGIISLFTYNGDMEGYELDPGATIINYEGLQLQREFYSPEYVTPEEKLDHLPDFRNVLYWQPNIKTSIRGRNSAEFYTSDLKGRYEVVIEGISQDGRCGWNTINFEVR